LSTNKKHHFICKQPNHKGAKYSQTYEMVEKEKEIVNTWNGTPPIEDDITKPTD
jgi:hypothetical protein